MTAPRRHVYFGSPDRAFETAMDSNGASQVKNREQSRHRSGPCVKFVEISLKKSEGLQSGMGGDIKSRTGLVIDAYFSATKLEWLLDNVRGARARAERGQLAFGTADTWLAWKLTDGALHVTDPSNASRTMLYDIHAGRWDEDCSRCSGFRPGSCRRWNRPPRSTARPQNGCSGPKSRSPASRATSRPHYSDKPATAPAWPRTRTARGASCF
jgi:hypothetical protein